MYILGNCYSKWGNGQTFFCFDSISCFVFFNWTAQLMLSTESQLGRGFLFFFCYFLFFFCMFSFPEKKRKKMAVVARFAWNGGGR